MDNASYIGLSLQMALQTELDVVANNIANVNTTGYQGQHVMFVEYLAETNRERRSHMSMMCRSCTTRIRAR